LQFAKVWFILWQQLSVCTVFFYPTASPNQYVRKAHKRANLIFDSEHVAKKLCRMSKAVAARAEAELESSGAGS
jgi:hypothetical protein